MPVISVIFDDISVLGCINVEYISTTSLFLTLTAASSIISQVFLFNLVVSRSMTVYQ